MISCRTRGIILNVFDHGESDKIIVFFSPDLGKASCIAKGAKRSKKRFVNKLELFSLLHIQYKPARNNTLLFLDEADLENSFLSLRHHYDRYLAAMYLGELTLRFTREYDPDRFIFSLMTWALQALEDGRDPLETSALFHLRLLGSAGYEPMFDSCGFCGERVGPGHAYTLHADSGSVLCGKCRDTMRGSVFTLSLQTLKFLLHAQRTEIHNLNRLRLSRKNCVEALTLLHRYTQHLLQHDIHSWQQLSSLDPNLPGRQFPPFSKDNLQASSLPDR